MDRKTFIDLVKDIFLSNEEIDNTLDQRIVWNVKSIDKSLGEIYDENLLQVEASKLKLEELNMRLIALEKGIRE